MNMRNSFGVSAAVVLLAFLMNAEPATSMGDFITPIIEAKTGLVQAKMSMIPDFSAMIPDFSAMIPDISGIITAKTDAVTGIINAKTGIVQQVMDMKMGILGGLGGGGTAKELRSSPSMKEVRQGDMDVVKKPTMKEKRKSENDAENPEVGLVKKDTKAASDEDAPGLKGKNQKGKKRRSNKRSKSSIETLSNLKISKSQGKVTSKSSKSVVLGRRMLSNE